MKESIGEEWFQTFKKIDALQLDEYLVFNYIDLTVSQCIIKKKKFRRNIRRFQKSDMFQILKNNPFKKAC